MVLLFCFIDWYDICIHVQYSVACEVCDHTHIFFTTLPINNESISLRLLALILCSNCSNTFNKVLTTIGGHMLNYFLKTEGSLELAQHPSSMVEAFHSRHDSCTHPHTHTHTHTPHPHIYILNHNQISVSASHLICGFIIWYGG